MPNESDRPAGPNTLAPEMNPLSQPLLAGNLRRWAEVYFSNPPERRDQAVLGLLRQLGREQSAVDANENLAPASSKLSDAFERAGSESDRSEVVRCKTCGHDNSVVQKFCGMCGAPVQEQRLQSRAHFDQGSEQTWNPQSGRVADDEGNGPRYDDRGYEGGPGETESENGQADTYAYPEPAPNTNSLSLFQDVPRNGAGYDGPHWEYESSSSQPYRFYIGVILVAILLGLGYMAWKGTQTATQSHESSPPPPPPAAINDEPAPPAQAASNTKPEPPKAAPNNADARPAPKPVAETSNPESEPKPAPRSPNKPAAESASTAAAASGAKGDEELSIAERYLSGASGERRDTTEASQWLWRSVAKHNGRATLLLADLYLHGEGVSKNCDQARVLLDSAARKGISGAGERLRNLQAFGCQ